MNRYLRKIALFLPVLALLVLSLSPVSTSANNDLNIYFFWGEGCPHCAKEHELLNSLASKYPEIKVYDYEIYNNKQNAEFLRKISEEIDTSVNGVPFTIIGDEYFEGFSESITPEKIEERINYCLLNECGDSVANIVGVEGNNEEEEAGKEEPKEEKKAIIEKLNFPIIGEVNVSSFSLPLLTIAIGALDGFNPCAMWVLLFLISMLLGMENRKRMWILGGSFIIASAAVYFVFMAAWLNLILILGLVLWIRIIIGLVALISGGHNLKEYFFKKDDGCEVVNTEKRQKTFEKIKSIVQMNNFWLALGGIILLAFAVNLVELVCSAGFPAAYTQILALSNLATWQYYSYILLYVFIFMLDDLFVFIIAMVTLQTIGITTKYTRASKLIGGILMVIIGILMILKPQILMLGF